MSVSSLVSRLIVVVPQQLGCRLLFGAGLKIPRESEFDGRRGGHCLVIQFAIDDNAARRALHFVTRNGRLRRAGASRAETSAEFAWANPASARLNHAIRGNPRISDGAADGHESQEELRNKRSANGLRSDELGQRLRETFSGNQFARRRFSGFPCWSGQMKDRSGIRERFGRSAMVRVSFGGAATLPKECSRPARPGSGPLCCGSKNDAWLFSSRRSSADSKSWTRSARDGFADDHTKFSVLKSQNIQVASIPDARAVVAVLAKHPMAGRNINIHGQATCTPAGGDELQRGTRILVRRQAQQRFRVLTAHDKSLSFDVRVQDVLEA